MSKTTLEGVPMMCPHCKAELKEYSKFCPDCGMPLVDEESLEVTGLVEKRKKRIQSVLVVSLAAIVLLAAILFIILSGNTPDNDPTPLTTTVPATTIPALPFSDDPEAISKASQSVVKLTCYDKNGNAIGTGSGFAFFEDTLIVTNYHVIEIGASAIEASTETQEVFDLDYVIATDPDKDIAILATKKAHSLAVLQAGDSTSLQKGEKVVAIGSPLGFLNSVSAGVFSGYIDRNNTKVLQFTASISHGSSGGALFNDTGNVLGITSGAYINGQNINIAVPIADVKDLYANTDTSKKLTIQEFYDTIVPETPVYPVSYVLSHIDELANQAFIMEGWLSTFDISDTGWFFCTDTADEVYTGEDGYDYDHDRAMKGKILWGNYRYEMDGFTPEAPPSLSVGDHIMFLCIGIRKPMEFEGQITNPCAVIVDTITVLKQ